MKKVLSVLIVFIVFGFALGVVFSVARASLTFTSSSITGDSSFTNLTGSATTTIDVGASTLNLQTSNNGPIKTGTGAFTIGGALTQSGGVVSLASTTVNGQATTTGLSVTATLIIPTNQSLSQSGQIAIKTTSSTLNFYDGTAERVLDPQVCLPPFVIQNVTSTVSDEPIWFAGATSTITKLMSVNLTSGDTMTFNIIWGTSRNTASSSAQHLFTNNVTSTSNTTLDAFPTLVAFASTTVPANSVVRLLSTSAASSTEFSVSLCYRENP